MTGAAAAFQYVQYANNPDLINRGDPYLISGMDHPFTLSIDKRITKDNFFFPEIQMSTLRDLHTDGVKVANSTDNLATGIYTICQERR